MSSSILSLLSETEKKQLMAHRQTKVFRSGEILFTQGQPARHMFRVDKGKISLFSLMPNGDEKLFRVFMAGDVIAEVAMYISPRLYPMSAKADQDSSVSAFSCDIIDQLLDGSADLSRRMLGVMSNNVCNLMNTINILTQVNANQRLVMKLAEIYKQQNCSEGKMSLPITKKLLASQLGMTPETLSRSFKKLKTDGFIKESASNLFITDIEKLCESVSLTADIFNSLKNHS